MYKNLHKIFDTFDVTFWLQLSKFKLQVLNKVFKASLNINILNWKNVPTKS